MPLTLCIHKWEDEKEETVATYDVKYPQNKGYNPMFRTRIIYYKCSKCGLRKQQKFEE
jgi:hypothetical protein